MGQMAMQKAERTAAFPYRLLSARFVLCANCPAKSWRFVVRAREKSAGIERLFVK
jgi:hypothetical protein